jgi:putative ABC transport system permease protein
MLHKLRSFLTILGVIFGVASVVAMLAVGEGAGRQAMEQIRKLGSNNIIITSMKPQEDEEQTTQHSHMSIYGLFYDDVDRIRQSLKTVTQTVPVKVVRKEGRLGTRAMELRIVGTTPEWFLLVKRPMIAGRHLLQRDLEGNANAVVLTEFGARKLLATQNTIGQSIRLGSGHYEVVGIVKSESGEAGGLQTPDQEVDAYIPLKSAIERFGDVSIRRTSGSDVREKVELHQIIVEVADIKNVESAAEGINRMLELFHKKKDYRVSVPFALLRQAEQTQRTFNIVLGSIAGISLLVGGIGIMNIMLASVTERTREIGIRRAIGAKRKHIVRQFLIETIVLSTAGGFVGIILGISIPSVITRFSGMPTIITLWSLMLSVGISMGVGILFGLYPAIRAANLDPIIALRHE